VSLYILEIRPKLIGGLHGTCIGLSAGWATAPFKEERRCAATGILHDQKRPGDIEFPDLDE
jgi:hypothetical protein